MTDLDTGAMRDILPSTPLRRAASRLDSVLPPGFRVEIVDADPEPAPVLRVVTLDD
ncbi:hypothetical protein [Nocardia harenae]|uniref:hypothetical protein n=1 Tax=Nocardia harenae TaxID=358707 RepID=UPI000AF43964|nr:hypothetical protein [Nocardia harenae]